MPTLGAGGLPGGRALEGHPAVRVHAAVGAEDAVAGAAGGGGGRFGRRGSRRRRGDGCSGGRGRGRRRLGVVGGGAAGELHDRRHRGRRARRRRRRGRGGVDHGGRRVGCVRARRRKRFARDRPPDREQLDSGRRTVCSVFRHRSSDFEASGADHFGYGASPPVCRSPLNAVGGRRTAAASRMDLLCAPASSSSSASSAPLIAGTAAVAAPSIVPTVTSALPVAADTVCDPIDPAHCLLPFPNDFFTVADASTDDRAPGDRSRRWRRRRTSPASRSTRPSGTATTGSRRARPSSLRVPGLDLQPAPGASTVDHLADLARYERPRRPDRPAQHPRPASATRSGPSSTPTRTPPTTAGS